MAATIIDSPSLDFLPIHNDVFFTVDSVTSPSTTQVWWYAIIQYPNTISGSVTTPKFYYYPNTLNSNQVVFNISPVVESYLKIDHSNLFLNYAPLLMQQCNDYLCVRIYIGERDINGNETQTDYTQTYIMFDGYFEDWEFDSGKSFIYTNIPDISTLQSPYNLVLGVPEYPDCVRNFEATSDWDKIDWNAPAHLTYDDPVNLSAMLPIHIPVRNYSHNLNTYILEVVVRCKDGQYKDFYKDITGSINTGLNYDNLVAFNFNRFTLNSVVWDAVTVPTGKSNQIDWNEDDKYAVFLLTRTGRTLCYTRPILFAHTCAPFGDTLRHYTIGYKTTQSSWQTIPFVMKADKSYDVKHSEYNKYIGSVDENYTNQSSARTIIKTNVEASLVLRTDWLDEYQIKQIEDLLKSREVYLLEPDRKNNSINSQTVGFTDSAVWTPVLVKTADYDIQYKKQDKLVRYDIEFEYSKNKTK